MNTRRIPIVTRLAALLLALGLVAAACSGGSDGDVGVLQQNLDAQNAALDALRDRVIDVVERLDANETRDPITDLNNLAGQVTAIEEAMAGVRAEIDQLTSADEDASASIEAEFGALSELVDQLVATLQDATRRIDDLETAVADLQEQQGE